MMGIYKFQNKINNKVYIGQSIELESRYKHHFNNYSNENLKGYDTKFYRALRKYGFENFTYEVLEQSLLFTRDELNEKEEHWISYYNSYNNGYNSNKGGERVTESGEDHPMTKLTNSQVLEIKNLLKNTKITQYELSRRYGISQAIVSDINNGKKWSSVGIEEKYPLRTQGTMRTGSKNHKSIFTDEEVREIRERYVNESGRDIYKDYINLCSYTTFERLLIGKTYTNLPVYKKKDKKWINN